MMEISSRTAMSRRFPVSFMRRTVYILGILRYRSIVIMIGSDCCVSVMWQEVAKYRPELSKSLRSYQLIITNYKLTVSFLISFVRWTMIPRSLHYPSSTSPRCNNNELSLSWLQYSVRGDEAYCHRMRENPTSTRIPTNAIQLACLCLSIVFHFTIIMELKLNTVARYHARNQSKL